MKVILDDSTITTSIFDSYKFDMFNDIYYHENPDYYYPSLLSLNNTILNMNPIEDSQILNITEMLFWQYNSPTPSPSSPNVQKCVLNFEGLTPFEDELGLAINGYWNVEQDLSWSKFGEASLTCSNEDFYGYTYYEMSKFKSYTCHGWFKISGDGSDYRFLSFHMLDSLWETQISLFIVGSSFDFDEVQNYDGQSTSSAIINIFQFDTEEFEWIDKTSFVSEIELDKEYHIAMTHENSIITIFLNGVKKCSVTIPKKPNPFTEFEIGLIENTNVDAVEITSDILWTDDFEVPTSPPVSSTTDEDYNLSNLQSWLILPTFISDSNINTININGSSSLAIIEADNLTIETINVLNFQSETYKYYFLNSYYPESMLLNILENFNQDIGDNKFIFEQVDIIKNGGEINLNNTMLRDCIAEGENTQFNSLKSLGNIDGGGNVGWYFGEDYEEPDESDPEPIPSFIPKIICIM